MLIFMVRRSAKYQQLAEGTIENIAWQKLQPQYRFYFFIPQDHKCLAEYHQSWSVKDIFLVKSTGVKTHRDHFVIDIDKDILQQRIL